jgi:glyoxylase-like metal-dependent hydrolase (beta-lactamase superfamily II)
MTHIRRIEVPIPTPARWVNCYYIEDSTPTLIDTGVNSDEGLDVIGAALANSGRGFSDLRRIIITHGHMDHAGLAGRLADLTRAELFIHPWEVNTATGPGPELGQRVKVFDEFLLEAGVPQTARAELEELIRLRYQTNFSALPRYALLNDGDTFPFDDFSLEVIHTSGHSPGSVCLFDRENGILISGDTILEEVTCNPSTNDPQVEPMSTGRILAASRSSLRLIESLPIQQVLPSHGLPFSNHRKRIRRILDHHERRRGEILRVLDEQAQSQSKTDGMTQYMVVQKLFPPMTGIECYHRCCAVRVHLEELAEEGLVERSSETGGTLYRLR